MRTRRARHATRLPIVYACECCLRINASVDTVWGWMVEEKHGQVQGGHAQAPGGQLGVSGGGYKLELEALAPIDRDIVEIPATS